MYLYLKQAERPVILIDGPFGDYERLVKEGHKTVNFYVNDEVSHAIHILISTPSYLQIDICISSYLPSVAVRFLIYFRTALLQRTCE